MQLMLISPAMKDGSYGQDGSAPSLVAETAARYGLAPRQFETALRLTRCLIPEELALVEALADGEELDLERRRRLARGLQDAVAEYLARPLEDPLADVDEPMGAEDGPAAALWADLEAGERRVRLLGESVGAAEAGRLTGRSRQAVERQRRDGRILALRVGRRWRYPAWQFDTDGPGGVVPRLSEVVALLHLSPAGAGHWLRRPRPELGGETPIRLLRHRDPEPVLRLAERLGHLP